MRLLFFGTPEFAVPSLEALAAAGHAIVGVVTRPDRATGRGLKAVGSPPVARAARALRLDVLQPVRPSAPEFVDAVRALRPDAHAVVAYGHLLPDPLLDAAPLGAWNVHPSLLPRWRGPAPIHRALWAGDDRTGVSIIRLIAKMDAGPIGAQEEVAIEPGETRGELEARLAELGARMLVDTLGRVGRGTLVARDQDDAAATPAPMFGPDELMIDWRRPAPVVDALVRALSPTPGAAFLSAGVRVKALAARPALPGEADGEPGRLLERGRDGGWRVGCGRGSLWITRVQPAGKGAMAMDAYLAGRRLKPGDALD